MLEHGTEGEQYAALLGLRFRFGYEAFADGEGPERVWRVTAPGAVEHIIKPKITPEPYVP